MSPRLCNDVLPPAGREADAIRKAADESGRTLSDWIRQACADRLDPTAADRRDEAVREAVVDAVEHLTITRDLLHEAFRGSPPVELERLREELDAVAAQDVEPRG